MKRQCGHCLIEFNVDRNQVLKGRGKYCSTICFFAARKGMPRIRDSSRDPKAWVFSHCQPIPECGCWICNDTLTADGYGRIYYQGKRVQAHRFSWESFNEKKIPNGLVVMHKCDTPSCINPDHLLLGTQADNMADRDRKGRGRPGGIKAAGTHNISASKIKSYEGVTP